MATIDDLPIPHFSALSREEQMELILRMRTRRRELAKVENKKRKTKDVIQRTIDKLSPEQLMQLMEQLGARK